MRISIITSIYSRNDGISEIVQGTARALVSHLQAEVQVYCSGGDLDGVNVIKISSSAELLCDQFFKKSHLLIYHFGIYYKFFNTILLGNGFAPQIVRFHNVTPTELVPEGDRSLIEASLRQIANIGDADEVWVDSAYNRHVLIEYGIDSSAMVTIPLYAKMKYDWPYRTDKIHPLQILYLGRFVKSKGVMDIIDVTETLKQRGFDNFRIILAGSENFSDPSYIAILKAAINDRHLRKYIEFTGTVDDDRLMRLYRESSIFIMPSYHEGFCLPIAEAMASRCIPVAYATGNIPDLVGDLGKLAPVGDRGRLGDLLAEAIADLAPPMGKPRFSDPKGLRLPLEHYDRLVGERLEVLSYKNFADAVVERVTLMADADGKRVRDHCERA